MSRQSNGRAQREEHATIVAHSPGARSSAASRTAAPCGSPANAWLCGPAPPGNGAAARPSPRCASAAAAIWTAPCEPCPAAAAGGARSERRRAAGGATAAPGSLRLRSFFALTLSMKVLKLTPHSIIKRL
eukprot:10979226-Lingulodinium_polyedra.AAC.1